MSNSSKIVGLVFLLLASVDSEVFAVEERPLPAWMANTQYLMRAKVLRIKNVGHSFFENSFSYVRVRVIESYRGPVARGQEVTIELEGWLGSEAKDRERFQSAMDEGEDVIVASQRCYNAHQKKLSMHTFIEMTNATSATKELASLAARLPVGWSSDGQKHVSVWAARKEQYPSDATEHVLLKCSSSGRPAWLCDRSLRMEVDVLHPDKSDTLKPVQFQISISNPTNRPIPLQALRSANGKILWNESILFVNSAGTWLPRSFRSFTPSTSATVVPAGKTVTGTLPFTACQDNGATVCLGNTCFVLFTNFYDVAISDDDLLEPEPPFQPELITRE